ncbi:Hsp20/alpha crystallin family [Nakaseomyces glabratus]|nr:Hsp20/alpha crystallin family [Nakaseomyces glabratus]KAH7595712.1 Hsp20/alpha crystallin family [Nakaseomyces glabratus]KAI8399353.1 Hsp20/alpha crystallin family [Nakaseomyces glabratus]
MSFYQPSLSLYDVLDALQAPRQRQPRAYGSYGPYAPYGTYGTHGTHGTSYPYGQRHPLHHVRSTPYYRFGNPYYYSPEYYEDEDEDEGEDVQDGDEDVEMGEKPSYYHDNSGKAARSAQEHEQQYQADNGLVDILNALLGGYPPMGNTVQLGPQGQQQRQQQQQQQEEPEVEEPQEPKQKPAAVQQPEPQAQETPQESKPHSESKPAQQPKLKKRASSSAFVHQQAPSPVPDPLQISKPETRLDLPFSPEVNLYDTEDTYHVVLALPGACSKAFRIDYHPSSHELLIKGNIEDKIGIDEKYLKITELKYGAFERTVKFPVLPRIKDESIKASYSNGLLHIKVPKILDGTEKPAPKKRITIEDVPDEELEFEENPNPVQA